MRTLSLSFFLAGKEIWRNRGRFLLFSLVIALITLLVLFIAALGEGLGNGNREYIANIDGELVIFRENSDFNITASRLDQTTARAVRRVAGVADAGAISTSTTAIVLPEDVLKVSLLGVEQDRPGFPTITEGETFSGGLAREAIVDSNVLSRSDIKIGDEITVRSTQGTEDEFYDLKVVGTTDGQSYFFQPSIFVSPQTWERTAIGRNLVEPFRAAGLPAGVFNFVPGRTEVIAEYLISHPAVTTIAFTGSTRTGLKIIENASIVRPGQAAVKRMICEMGGKNAIIIDDDADLNEAVPAVLTSAFGFQGQKCSSCSRVIVLEAVHDAFVARLIDAAESLPVGPAYDPAFVLGPVCDAESRTRIEGYIDIAGREGRILYSGKVPPGNNYVPVTIVGDITPEHRLAQEEIFGPVLAVMKVKTFDQALEWAISTMYALTGGVFSRSPRHLDEAKMKFQAGNIYLNRHITGALVGRQPFGGFKMSGLGTKAGGEEYLLHFMDPRVVTENTARRGFSPDLLLKGLRDHEYKRSRPNFAVMEPPRRSELVRGVRDRRNGATP